MSERRAEGVLLSGRSLVLQNVTRQKSGNYSCRAATERGEGVARAMDLRVQCESGAARAMDLRVQCESRRARAMDLRVQCESRGGQGYGPACAV